MEFACEKRSRNRRRRKRHNKRKKRGHFEVTFANKQKVMNFGSITYESRPFANIMEANAFWQNYAAAQDWQKRHNIVWWRTRCRALEHENNILKNKIRNLISNNYNQKQYPEQQNYTSNSFKEPFTQKAETVEHDPVIEDEEDDEEEDLVFQMNDDMMKFLEQSMRHKMELKKMKESQNKKSSKDDDENDEIELDGGQKWVEERVKTAELLYGKASSQILAMETALQATIERHIDKTKPQLWPNIPLNLKFN